MRTGGMRYTCEQQLVTWLVETKLQVCTRPLVVDRQTKTTTLPICAGAICAAVS